MSGGQGKRRTDPGYGQGVVRLQLDDALTLEPGELRDRLLEIFSAPDYRPPTLPAVAIELTRLSQKPDVSFEEIVALLEQDSLIVGRIMKLLKSPVYAGSANITSLKAAVVRLGLNTLRDIVLEISMNMKVFRADSYSDAMDRLRRHSTITAHLSRMICRYTAIEGEYAFLCGLLHDVGIAGALLTLSEGQRKKGPSDLITLWPVIDEVHEPAASCMTRLWELPQEIQWVVGAHHRVKIEGYAHPLAATVCVANALAEELGFTLVPDEGEAPDGMDELESACLGSHSVVDQTPAPLLREARAALSLTDEQMDLIRAEAQQLREDLNF